MSSIINFSLKINGEWKNYTASVEDKTNDYGNNVSIYEAQSKEQREAKVKKVFVGNGKVAWTDGNITKADFIQKDVQNTSDKIRQNDLPF